MRKTALAVLACLAAGCGSEWHLPFSNANPTLPSNITLGAPPERPAPGSTQPAPQATALPAAGPRNRGTRVWLVPVPGGDMLRLAREPELWAKARARVDVFSFYAMHAYYAPENTDYPQCRENICGPNTFQAFMEVVPGGMFKWMYDQGIQLSFEAGAVKSFACTPEKVRGEGEFSSLVIRNMESTGARVSFIKLDEPFFSGTNPKDTPGFGGCALTMAETAALVKFYGDTVHARYPHVQVGLIEPYPAMSADGILSAVLELEHLGVRLPFLHIDYDAGHGIATGADTATDLRRIRDFCEARDIPFGVIVTGKDDGGGNKGFAAGAWALLRQFHAAVGVPDDLVFQSWAEAEFGNLNSRKHKPDTVPESDPATHNGQLLAMLEYLNIQPAR